MSSLVHKSTSVLFAVVLSLQAPAFCQHSKGVTNTIIVNAKVQAVFHAIQQARTCGGFRKLVSYKNNQAVIEEQFQGLPLIGSAKCVYQENEVSPNRIDYKMIESDKLSKFEGSWILKDEGEGRTSVTLTSETECGLKLPFADKLTVQSATKRVDNRLHEIAKVAEADSHIATERTEKLLASK
ncbi:MAG TPA: SRPBCC family protein [Oculatellaceae cyanobacterium]